jgi:hypothetical protein
LARHRDNQELAGYRRSRAGSQQRAADRCADEDSVGPGYRFRLKNKNESPSARDGQWFVLVALRGELERPAFYVIPSDHVAAMIYAGHRDWLAKPDRGGKPRKDSDQRILSETDVLGYLERWDLLQQGTRDVPFLADHLVEYVREVGLPPGHAGVPGLFT